MLALGYRLGVVIATVRAGGRPVPQWPAAGRRDASWRGGFAEVEEDVADRGRVVG